MGSRKGARLESIRSFSSLSWVETECCHSDAHPLFASEKEKEPSPSQVVFTARDQTLYRIHYVLDAH